MTKNRDIQAGERTHKASPIFICWCMERRLKEATQINREVEAAAKYFVAWELDDMGKWVKEKRVATLEEARQLLADKGCAEAGEVDHLGRIFFVGSWKFGLSSVEGEIQIVCKNEARRAELIREAAKALPAPSADARAEYEATRGKTYPQPTAEEMELADEIDHNSMVDATLAEKQASYKNYPA
jgi:hypothetical protein